MPRPVHKTMTSAFPIRKQFRLNQYDYTSPGYYFVTVCTYQKQFLFGSVQNKTVQLNQMGMIVSYCWNEIPQHFNHVLLDTFVIMPNHLHAIVALGTRATRASPLQPPVQEPQPVSLGVIIGLFKSAASKQINQFNKTQRPIWQRSFYDHIIRNENELHQVRQYILDNPAKRDEDPENVLSTTNKIFTDFIKAVLILILLTGYLFSIPATVFADSKTVSKFRYEHLKQEIKHHNELYYKQSAPEISDQKYDSLTRELISIEERHPEWILPESPSQKPGSDLDLSQKTFPHGKPMLSLQNTDCEEGLLDFDRRVREQLKIGSRSTVHRAPTYFIEEKIDGAGISLQYESGKLKHALTRGDGVRGNDITKLAKNIFSIPHSLPAGAPQFIEIRGEVYLAKSDFVRINEKRKRAGQKPFANPRNAAAGSLHLKNPEAIKIRDLRFFAYAVGKTSEPISDTQQHLLEKLSDFGFPANPGILCASAQQAIQAALDIEAGAEKLDYQIDGVVIKVNNLNDQYSIPGTSKDQGGMIAFKFRQKEAVTEVQEIIFQVGRTGRITPVAILRPVQLDGSKIERVTLNNLKRIQDLNVRPGDSVRLQKGGRVIPKIISVIHGGQKLENQTPSPVSIHECPVCHFKITNKNGLLRCDNENCPGRLKTALLYFAGKSQMNIRGLGEALAEEFIHAGAVRTPADLYRLDLETLREMNGMSEKAARALLQEIEESKERPFSKLLSALGIPQTGPAKTKRLAEHFEDLETLESATPKELESLDEIGISAAQSISNFLNRKETQEMFEILKHAGF